MKNNKTNRLKVLCKLFTVLFVFNNLNTFAQWDKKNQDVNLYGSFGVSSFKPKWGDLDIFTQSFNTKFANDLESPFTGFNRSSKPFFEFGIDLGNSIDIGVRKQLPTSYKSIATFKNGEKKEFEYRSSMSQVNMAFNIFHIKKVFFGATFGAIFETGNLKSGYRYKNNFLSYGIDNRTNAIFTIKNNFYTGGFQAYFVPIENVGVTFQWEKVGFKFLEFKSTIKGASGELRDNLDGVGTFYSNHTYTTFLATDYADINNSNIYFVGSQNTAKADIAGSRFLVSVRFNLRIVKTD